MRMTAPEVKERKAAEARYARALRENLRLRALLREAGLEPPSPYRRLVKFWEGVYALEDRINRREAAERDGEEG